MCSTLVVGATGDIVRDTRDLLLQTQATAGQNDGGSGHDASGMESTATRLPGPGEYTGTLASSSDADWFGLAPSSPDVCVEGTVDGPAGSDVEISLPGQQDVRNKRFKGASHAATLAVAGAGVADVRLGLSFPSSGNRVPGDYGFQLTTFTASDLLATGDGNSGEDAGDTRTTATAVGSGCMGGSLDSGDADVYALDLKKGRPLLLSLAQVGGEETVTAELVDPTGQTTLVLRDGDATSFTPDATGTWYLEVTGSQSSLTASQLDLAGGSGSTLGGSSDYILGIDGPDPPGCAPSC